MQSSFGYKNAKKAQKRGLIEPFYGFYQTAIGDPNGIRTHDTTVKGWCLNRLTMGPQNIKKTRVLFFLVAMSGVEPLTYRV